MSTFHLTRNSTISVWDVNEKHTFFGHPTGKFPGMKKIKKKHNKLSENACFINKFSKGFISSRLISNFGKRERNNHALFVSNRTCSSITKGAFPVKFPKVSGQ